MYLYVFNIFWEDLFFDILFLFIIQLLLDTGFQNLASTFCYCFANLPVISSLIYSCIVSSFKMGPWRCRGGYLEIFRTG